MYIGVVTMSKAKGKGGTGRGTDSKGWTRWKSSAKGKKAVKGFGTNPGDKAMDSTVKKSPKRGVNVAFGEKVVNGVRAKGLDDTGNKSST